MGHVRPGITYAFLTQHQLADVCAANDWSSDIHRVTSGDGPWYMVALYQDEPWVAIAGAVGAAERLEDAAAKAVNRMWDIVTVEHV